MECTTNSSAPPGCSPVPPAIGGPAGVFPAGLVGEHLVQLLAIKLAFRLLVEATYPYVPNALVVLPRRCHHLTLPPCPIRVWTLPGKCEIKSRPYGHTRCQAGMLICTSGRRYA